MKKLQSLIIVVFIIHAMSLQAQLPNLPSEMSPISRGELGIPFIRNYEPDEYQAHMQNWAVIQDKRGVMYFGLSSGVLEFDGEFWNHIPMPNHTSVRSLARDTNGTIYVGTMGEFGFLAFDKTGMLTYVSLSDTLPEKDKNFKNVWRTHATEYGIYFETSEKMFRFYRGEIEVLSISVDRSYPIKEGLILKKNNENRLHVLKGNRLQVLPHTERIPWESAGRLVILPYTDNKILIATQNEGIYVYDLDLLLDEDSFVSDFSKKSIPPEVLKKLSTEIEEFLRYNELYHAVQVNDHCYAFGTSEGGIVMMDQEGRLIQLINKNCGLQNDNVHNLYVDQDQNLWAALNKGNSYIEINSPITKFDEGNGLETYAETCIRHKGTLYIATHNGCFYLSDPKTRVKNDKYHILPVKNYNTDCWSFISIKNMLLAGGTNYIYQIKDHIAKPIKEVDRLYCFGYTEKFPDYVFVGLREGFAALHLKEKDGESKDFQQVKYIDDGRFKKVNNIIRKITSDSNGDLWLTTRYSGIIYLRFTGQDISDFQIYRYHMSHGLPREDYNRVYFINDRLVVASMKGIFQGMMPEDFQANPSDIQFVPEETFGQLLPDPSASVHGMHVDQKQDIWVTSNVGVGRFVKNGSNYTWDGIPFKKVTVSDVECYIEPDGIVWCSGPDAFCRIDVTQQKNYQRDYNTLIRKVLVHRDKAIFNGNYYSTNSEQLGVNSNKTGKDSLKKVFCITCLDQPEELMPVLKHQDNSLTFEYSATFYENTEANLFQHILQGFDKDWSRWTDETRAVYTNLPAGDYCFKVKAKNIFEHQSSLASYRFSISPPWYQTIFAFAGYGLLFLALFFGGIRWNSRRLIAAKLRLEIIVKRRTAQAELIYKTGQRLSSKLELESLLSEIVIAVRDAFNYYGVMLMLLDTDTNRLKMHSITGGHAAIFPEDLSFAIGEGMIGTAAEYGETQVCNNILDDKNYIRIADEVTKSELAVPTKKGEELIGVLDIQSDQLNTFHESDMAAMETLSTQIATAIENARLYEAGQHELSERKKTEAKLRESNEQIMSSIRYAKTIQQAILPLAEKIESSLPEHFIIYKPRDIVSGDFYWFNKIDSKVIIAVVDCTGHGVPGAFMSMIGNTLLNDIVNEQRITDPALILENLHTEVRFALKQENGKTVTQDGMDVCLCTLERGKKKIAFAGAKRPLYIVRNPKSTAGSSEFIEIKGNRKSIGGRQKEKKRSFSNNEIEVQHGDMIYLTSDGFVDQNDSEGKKYGSRRLKEFLKTHAHLLMDKQREMLLSELEHHQGEEDQRDDITMVGVKV